MAQKPFTSETVVEALSTFESGVDSGVAPQLLKANQLSFGTNLTVRGAFASHRPPFTKQTLDYGGNAAMKTMVEQGHFQGWCYYKPDNVLTPIPYVIQSWTAYAMEQIVASISGHIFVFTPDTTIPNLWHVTDVTIPGDPNDPNAPQVWLWQAEKWMIITDGTLKLPIFFNGISCRRSIGNDMNVLVITQAGTDANFVANGSTWNITLQNAPANVWALGTPISGVGIGEYIVTGLWGGTGTGYTLTRTSAVGPIAGTAAFVSPNTVQNIYPELPAGRVGCYGMGRVWMSLTDAKQFIGGDINGGPSGTLANGYRDAVLHTSENSLIAGGGAFSTPGACGRSEESAS